MGDQTIHLVQENKAHREEVRSRELKRRVGAISRIDLFARLSEAEQEDLAHRLINAPSPRATCCSARATWPTGSTSSPAARPRPGGRPRRRPQRLIDTRGPGNVFGELGLMTGAPRRSTVIAITDVEAYRLDKASLEHILRARPELAEGISVILENAAAALPPSNRATPTAASASAAAARADASAPAKDPRILRPVVASPPASGTPMPDTSTLLPALDAALQARRGLIARLAAEQTDAYRLFHGTVEGQPGLTVDRYGSLILVQSFHGAPAPAQLDALQAFYASAFPGSTI